jgi:hypothetical protein
MLVRLLLSYVLLTAVPGWAQVAAKPADTTTNSGEGDQMQTPPPVSGDAYPVEVGSEARSNYLRFGLVINTAYSDNILPGSGTGAISDASYSIRPQIAFDQTTSRLHQTLTYSPGFTFYQSTHALDQADHSLGEDFQYRFSPHVTASVQGSFRKSTNAFNQISPEGTVSGSGQSPLVGIIALNANQINSSASAELTHQFSRNGMIGASGSFTGLSYPDPAQAPGLSNSNSWGGSAFYNQRISEMRYIGVTYQYVQIVAAPNTENKTQTESESKTETQTPLLFFTMYFKPKFSLSLSAGPQYYDVSQSTTSTLSAWSPAIMTSIGWQGPHTSFAAGYSQRVSGGGGLIGAFNSKSADASARWQFARAWTVGSSGGYAISKNVDSSMSQTNPGGRTVSGIVMVGHPINEHFNLELGYSHLRQNYSGIVYASNNPNTNREYVSISYELTRPLGR